MYFFQLSLGTQVISSNFTLICLQNDLVVSWVHVQMLPVVAANDKVKSLVGCFVCVQLSLCQKSYTN